jgi:hypothetical protein
LESQRFLIVRKPVKGGASGVYNIFDTDRNELIGSARDSMTARSGFVKWLANNRLASANMVVREAEDESLLFTVRRPVSLWRQRAEVYDADDQLVGYFQGSWFDRGPQLSIFDRFGRVFASTHGDASDSAFITPDGLPVGEATRLGGGAPGNCEAPAGSYMVTIHQNLADEPMAKMLVLAAALMCCAKTRSCSTESQSC